MAASPPPSDRIPHPEQMEYGIVSQPLLDADAEPVRTSDSDEESDDYGDGAAAPIFTGLYGLLPDTDTAPLPMWPSRRD